NGHPVDLQIGSLTLGRSSSNPTANSPGNATISFDNGTLDVTNVIMGLSAGTSSFATANGTLNVGTNGTLLIGSGGLSLVNQAAASGAATGTLNVNGGTVISTGNIGKTTAAGTGTVTVNGGKVTLNTNILSIGTAVMPINVLNLTNSTLTIPL